MDTIFMNSENSRTPKYHLLVLKFTDKLDLRRGQKSAALSNLSVYYTWKKHKKIRINLHSISDIQYQIFQII